MLFDYSRYLRRCLFKVGVFHHVIEPVLLFHLSLCTRQARLECCRILGSALPEAPGELIHRRWEEEDEDGIGNAFPHLHSALNVDFEHRVLAESARVLDRCDRGSVEMPENLCVLQKGLVIEEFRELLIRGEGVLHTVTFVRARRASRDRSRKE